MPARRVCVLLGLVLLAFSNSGCRTANESKLTGTYRAETSCVKITLVVNSDHSFVQSARTATGETNQLTGRWTVDKGDKMITFEPFLDFQNNAHGRQLGFANFSPEGIGPMVHLGPVIVKCYDSEYEVDYNK